MNENTPASTEPTLPPAQDDAAPEAAAAAPEAAAPEAPAAAPAAEAAPTNADVGAELKALFPALFSGGAKPLKLRIQADIQERAPNRFTKQQLSAFFRRYTGSTTYLIALTKATQRFDLDGQPAGELAEEHLVAAREELARRKGLKQERVNAERAQHQQAAKAEREERQLLDQQRWNRAGLLHDFERTTLTLKNFCTLKGVSEEELPGLLEIARKERAERPPAPARMQQEQPRRPQQPRREGGEGGGRRDGQGRPPKRGGGGKPPARRAPGG